MKRNLFIRNAVATVCFIGGAIGYACFIPVGTYSSFGFGDISLLCPIGALTAMIAGRTLIPQALISLTLFVVFVLLFGRAFCGWVCSVPLLQRIRGKERFNAPVADGDRPGRRKHTRREIIPDIRYWMLCAVLLVAAAFALPVFCMICPVGLSFALIFLLVRLFAFGQTTWMLIIVAGILVVEVFFLRSWCHTLCPIGALMSLISHGNHTFVPRANTQTCLVTSNGSDCGLCAKACSENITLAHLTDKPQAMHDCTKCRLCADVCPVHAINFPFLPALAQKKTADHADDGV